MTPATQATTAGQATKSATQAAMVAAKVVTQATQSFFSRSKLVKDFDF